MKSQTKKRLLAVVFYSVLIFWSAIGFWPIGTLGVPFYVWLYGEAVLLGVAITVTASVVYDWVERDG